MPDDQNSLNSEMRAMEAEDEARVLVLVLRDLQLLSSVESRQRVIQFALHLVGAPHILIDPEDVAEINRYARNRRRKSTKDRLSPEARDRQKKKMREHWASPGARSRQSELTKERMAQKKAESEPPSVAELVPEVVQS